MQEKLNERRFAGRTNAIWFYVIGGILTLMALWAFCSEMVFQFTIPEEELASYAEAELGWTGLEQKDVLESTTILAYRYETADGSQAAATAFTRGLFGRYKFVASAEPAAESREMEVRGTEERLLIQVQPGKELEIVGVASATWFGLVVINVILCGLAFATARKQQKLQRARKEAQAREAERKAAEAAPKSTAAQDPERPPAATQSEKTKEE